MKKKLLPISLLCLVTMILAGCGGKTSSSNSQAPSSSGEPSSVVPSSSSETPVPSSSSVAPSSSSSSAPSSSSSSSSSSVAPQPVAVTGVALDKQAANVILGQTLQLTATVSPQNADNKEVTWSSSDPDVASVKDGLVKAEGVGQAEITVKTRDGGKTAKCVITVIKEITSVSITNKSAFEGFIVDDMESINVEVDPADNVTALLAAGALKATSSDPTVASVVGLTVTALKEGKTTIKVELFGKEDSFELNVGDAIPGVAYTIANAFVKGFEEAPWNGKAGAGSNISATCFELQGKVLAVSPNGSTAVDIILDDGTQAAYLQFTKGTDEVFPVVVGDYAKVTCKFTNYYGLLEGVSRKAEDEKTSPKIPLKDIVKLDAPGTPVTPFLNDCEELDATSYEAYYNICNTNGTKDDLNATYTSLKHAKLAITYVDDPSNTNFKYVIDGTNGKYGLEIYESALKDEPFDGQKSTVEVFLISCNTGKSKSNSILIEQTPLAVESVVIDQEAQEIVHGSTLEMSYTTTPAGSYARNVVWTSSDETVATIDENGVLTGIYVGEGTKSTNVKVALGDKESAAVEISVFGEDKPATAAQLDKTTLELVEGQKDKLVPTTEPAKTSDLPVWSSSDETVVKVDQKGNIEALAAGTAEVTVKYNDTVSAKCAVTVVKLTAATNYVGAHIDTVGVLVAKNKKNAMIDDGTGGLFTYATADVEQDVGTLVKVSGTTKNYNGGIEIDGAKVEAAPAGTAAVTPISATPISEAEVAAELAARLANGNYTVRGRKVSLRTGVIGGSGSYLTWQYGESLMETSIATGGMKTGLIYDIEGYLVNFYKSGNLNYLCICVTSATQVHIDPTGVSLDKNYLELEVGAQATLKATQLPAGAGDAATWASSNEAVATVANGKVTAVAEGKATITVTVGQLVDSCEVTVKAAAGQDVQTVTLVADGLSAAYGTNEEKTFDGVKFDVTKVANYGNGIQFQNNDATALFNKDAFTSPITKILFNFNTSNAATTVSNQSATKGALKVLFATKADFSDAGDAVLVKIPEAQKECSAEITPNVSGAVYAKIMSGRCGAVYCSSIVFNPASSGETPVEIANPNGNYSGYLVMPTAQGNLNVFTCIALGDELAYVEIYLGEGNANNLKVQTTYAYDKTSGLVTIVLGGIYGNLTAFYDATNDKLTQVGVHGSAAALLSNNLTAELTNASALLDCNGSTAVLQAMFKRRYMSGSWQVDTGNADRFVSYEKGVSGSAMQRRGWTGGAVAVNLAADIEGGMTASNIGFWVYNPSANDVTLRLWVYKAANLGSNQELVDGGVKAKAGQWTYIRVGFASTTIYNFQIADFTNSGVALVFDNICAF